MKESKIQAEIIQLLKNKGYLPIKVQVANFNGVADIIACSPKGHFIALEVKTQTGRASKLQEVFIQKVQSRGGIAAIVRSVDDVRKLLNL